MGTWHKIQYCTCDKRLVGRNTQLREFKLNMTAVSNEDKDHLLKCLPNGVIRESKTNWMDLPVLCKVYINQYTIYIPEYDKK